MKAIGTLGPDRQPRMSLHAVPFIDRDLVDPDERSGPGGNAFRASTRSAGEDGEAEPGGDKTLHGATGTTAASLAGAAAAAAGTLSSFFWSVSLAADGSGIASSARRQYVFARALSPA